MLAIDPTLLYVMIVGVAVLLRYVLPFVVDIVALHRTDPSERPDIIRALRRRRRRKN